ncbi:MAG: hypothetical protein ACRC7O_17425 [Fimbriiglobus sp.]
MSWLRRMFVRTDPIAVFPADRAALAADFLRVARTTGRPRGLWWMAAEPAGEPLFARDSERRILAFLPVIVTFEPESGSEMEDVPQARGPRPVTAVFAFDGRAWRPTGKGVFNLSPAEAARRLGLEITAKPAPR